MLTSEKIAQYRRWATETLAGRDGDHTTTSVDAKDLLELLDAKEHEDVMDDMLQERLPRYVQIYHLTPVFMGEPSWRENLMEIIRTSRPAVLPVHWEFLSIDRTWKEDADGDEIVYVYWAPKDEKPQTADKMHDVEYWRKSHAALAQDYAAMYQDWMQLKRDLAAANERARKSEIEGGLVIPMVNSRSTK